MCPVTGFRVAKDVEANRRQRLAILEAAAEDSALQREFLVLSARSCLAWINLFAWTYVLVEQSATGRKATKADTDQPFVTWPVQDNVVNAIQKGMDDGVSLAVTKSREMGASWICLAKLLWDTLYVPGSNPLIGSRKEDLVDKPHDSDTLFWKLDFMLDRLPDWMRPVVDRKHMSLHFPELRRGIDGEATNKDFGRGGRRSVILIDEAAAIDELRAIDNATQDSTPCRLFNTTPRRGSYFGLMMRSGKLRVARMPWWDHPVKGAGRRMIVEEGTGERRFTSPWYEAEVAKRVDQQDIRENLDMDDAGGSSVVFDNRTIDVQVASYGCPPDFRGDVVLPRGVVVDRDLDPEERPVHLARFVEDRKGPLRWWGPLVLVGGVLTPRPHRERVVGVDVSMGVGASDSVASILDAETGDKEGRWSSNRVMPGEFADVLYLLGHWLGTKDDPAWLCIESNGPGGGVLLRLREMGYPKLYQHRELTEAVPKKKPELGWRSNRVKKRHALEVYRTALARHEMKNHDVDALEQARSYVNYTGGGIGPLAQAGANEEERDQHGDMVIADMLAFLGSMGIPLQEPPERSAPVGSFAWRQAERQRRRLQRTQVEE